MGVQSIGMPVRREEDFRLLRGKGRYVDDVRLPREAPRPRLRLVVGWAHQFVLPVILPVYRMNGVLGAGCARF